MSNSALLCLTGKIGLSGCCLYSNRGNENLKWALCRSWLCVDAGSRVHCKYKHCISTYLKWWHHTYKILCTTRNKKNNILETLEMVVGRRGCCHDDSGKEWANGCSAVIICFLIGSLTIYTANHWKNPAHLFSPIHIRAITHTHTQACSRHTGKRSVCFSVSLWSSHQ